VANGLGFYHLYCFVFDSNDCSASFMDMYSPKSQTIGNILNPVYTIQPVVNPVVQCDNRLYNGFDNQLYRVNKHPTGCQYGCQTGLTTSWMFVYTIQPVVKPCLSNWLYNPVWQPCWRNRLFVQPVVKPGCTTGLITGCIHYTAVRQTGCQMGLTTGWMFVYTMHPVV